MTSRHQKKNGKGRKPRGGIPKHPAYSGEHSSEVKNVGVLATAADFAAARGDTTGMIEQLRRAGLTYIARRLSELYLPDFERMAYEMKRELNGERILVPGIGYGGFEDFEHSLVPYLSKLGIKFDALMLPQADPKSEMIDGEYRPILRSADPSMNPKGAKVAIPFESSAKRSGSGLIGGLVWTLYAYDILGVEKVYTAGREDDKGIMQFAAIRNGTPYIGPVDFMKENMPITYENLRGKGLLRLIPDYTPETMAYSGEMRTERLPFYSRMAQRVLHPIGERVRNWLLERRLSQTF